MRIAILHPDLGLGGAERLIVDAAYSLARKGNDVTIYTCHYDPKRSFEETRDGTFKVQVYGQWIPRQLGGKFHILFSMLQNMYLALKVSLVTINQLDTILCDQVSVCIPIFRLLRPFIGIVFYCHYPDLLLSPKSSWLKRFYRYPFDRLEEITTGLADIILVNSKFTQATFERTFTMLNGTKPMVVYPCIKIKEDEENSKPDTSVSKKKFSMDPSPPLLSPSLPNDKPVILLSINRYERKKGINIAIEAMGLIHQKYPNVHLIIAGGYDTRLQENVDHYDELVHIAKQCKLLDTNSTDAPMFETNREAIQRILPDWINDDKTTKKGYESIQVGKKITFIRSFTDHQKQCLLKNCTAVVYTPPNEHFGIVPLECMVNYRPVIACNSGGPLESVKEVPEKERTGYLCSPTSTAFATAMEKIVANREVALSLGTNGYQHVRSKFSRTVFGTILNDIMQTTGTASSLTTLRRQQFGKNLYLWFCLFLMIISVISSILLLPHGYRTVKEFLIIQKWI